MMQRSIRSGSGTVADALHAGDWVEVRRLDEILATLDGASRRDALPFMPEMIQYCGKRFRVYKSAHKTCDTLGSSRNRHMEDAVHLDGLRCDGAAHGGCQAACLLFWKGSWLKPVGGPHVVSAADDSVRGETGGADDPRGIPLDAVHRATRYVDANGEERFRCQATEMREATTPIGRWEIGHYLRDLQSRNVRWADMVRFALWRACIHAFQSVARLHWRFRRYPQYPLIKGLAEGKTPSETLDLKPGEWVRVRSKAEIMRTISPGQKNRGLWYDEEMLPHCNRLHRVLKRVERIVDERTGKLIDIPGGCIILDGVVCSGNRSSNRLFCPRSIYPYWREIWLRRVEPADTPRGD